MTLRPIDGHDEPRRQFSEFIALAIIRALNRATNRDFAPSRMTFVHPRNLVGMSIAAMGFYGSKGPFWAMPPMFLTGTAAAGAIAWINSLGNLGDRVLVCRVHEGPDRQLRRRVVRTGLVGLISAFISAFFLHIPNPAASVPALGALEAAE